jgi:hypothetical protein
MNDGQDTFTSGMDLPSCSFDLVHNISIVTLKITDLLDSRIESHEIYLRWTNHSASLSTGHFFVSNHEVNKLHKSCSSLMENDLIKDWPSSTIEAASSLMI